MRITRLKNNPNKYSGNSYLIRGSNNYIKDVNTLIDTGSDNYILKEIGTIYTGVGKRAVEQILLTHNHFDHAGGVKFISKIYNPKVYAFTKDIRVTNLLHDEDKILVGDRIFRVIYMPGHSNDSVCFYNYDDKVLFSGDCNLNLFSDDNSYSDEFLSAFEKIVALNINIIYPGHGEPIVNNINTMLKDSFNLATKTKK